MNCKSCAAPMTLVRDRDYWTCPYCGSTFFPSPNPDNVRVLGVRDDIVCADCRVPMADASLDGRAVLQCTRCEGLLVAQGVFGTVVRLRRAVIGRPIAEPLPIDPEQLRRSRSCSKCGGRMETFPYPGGGSVVIDRCGACGVVWLDRGEVTRLGQT